MKPDDDSGMETLTKIRIPRSTPRFVRELAVLSLLLIGLFSGLIAFAFIQYNFICLRRNSDMTIMQCFSGDYKLENRRTKTRPRNP